MKRVRSFKYNDKQRKVEVTTKNKRQDNKTDVEKLESNDEPKIELVQALQAMKKHLIQICELPAEWEDDITVRGVTAGWKSEVLGLVIRGVRDLEFSNTPMAINSPYAHQEHMEDEEVEDLEEASDDIGVLDPGCVDAYLELERLILRYVGGDRQQLQFNLEEGKEE